MARSGPSIYPAFQGVSGSSEAYQTVRDLPASAGSLLAGLRTSDHSACRSCESSARSAYAELQLSSSVTCRAGRISTRRSGRTLATAMLEAARPYTLRILGTELVWACSCRASG